MAGAVSGGVNCLPVTRGELAQLRWFAGTGSSEWSGGTLGPDEWAVALQAVAFTAVFSRRWSAARLFRVMWLFHCG